MSFVNNARVMLIGFALAQALPLLASPLLTRLFSPEAFGLQTLFISWTSVLAVLATLRLDLALVLADDRDEALRIASLATLQACTVSALVLVAVATFAPAISHITGQAGSGTWLWALAPMVLALAAVQICSGMLTWLKRFGPTSQAQVLNQAGYLAAAVALGVAAAPTEGLVAAKLAGQMLAALAVILVLRGAVRGLRIPSRVQFGSLWRKCRPFLLFNTPYSLVGVLGREVPIFAFSAVAATVTAGHYGLARTLLGAPATLLAASLSQVFYREAAEHRGSARLQSMTVGLLRVTLTATAPAFAFIAVWGDAAFALAFGADWATAGRYAMILAPAAWLSIQTAWPERLYESVGRQGVSFSIQIGFDSLATLTVFAAVFAGAPPILVVALFAVINSAFHLSYLTGMFKVTGFPLVKLVRVLLYGVAVVAASVSVMAALRTVDLPEFPGLLISAALTAAACLGLGLLGYRSLRVLIVQT